MKKIFIILFAALFLTACGELEVTGAEGTTGGGNGKAMFDEKPQTNLDKTAITGLWESTTVNDTKMFQKIRLRFNEKTEKAVIATECKYPMGDVTMYAQVESPAQFENNTVEILQTLQDYKEQTKDNVKYDCYISFPAGQYKMGLNGKIVMDEFVFSKIANN